jgi:hypothetical protein
MAHLRNSHRMHRFAGSRLGKNRWNRVALRAKRPIPAVQSMVLANVVFAGEGMFEVPVALMERGTLRAASFSVVHAGSHFSLAFNYASKTSTNFIPAHEGHTKFITNRGRPVSAANSRSALPNPDFREPWSGAVAAMHASTAALPPARPVQESSLSPPASSAPPRRRSRPG